jgi:mannose-1-phosphate guanylyltransferase/phosphomannomutase
MMDARTSEGIDYVGGTRGGFIFPGFQLGADALYATAKILELMAATRKSLAELRGKYDRFRRAHRTIPCPWSKRGTVMRQLITSSEEKRRELIDGVRVYDDGGWVLVSPDRQRALFNVTAEAESGDKAERLADSYAAFVEECQR